MTKQVVEAHQLLWCHWYRFEWRLTIGWSLWKIAPVQSDNCGLLPLQESMATAENCGTLTP